MNAKQFYHLIVTPTLHDLEPEIKYTDLAGRLVLETCYHESDRLEYLAQLPNNTTTFTNYGPAWGIAQMEKPTFDWLVLTVLPKRPQLSLKFVKISASYPWMNFQELAWNLKLSVALCRVRYHVVPEKLPNDSIRDRANYWFKYYNGSDVLIRRDQFIKNAEKLSTLC